jgi:hypothetical protein
MATVQDTNRYRNTGALYARETWNALQQRGSSTLEKLWAYLVAHPTLTQGVYYILISLWLVLETNSFLAVTGHNTDTWLVQTLGLMLLVIGGTLCLAAYRRQKSAEVVVLALASAGVLAATHLWFVLEDHISAVYLADTVLELGILFVWFYGWYRDTVTAPVAPVPATGQNGVPLGSRQQPVV